MNVDFEGKPRHKNCLPLSNNNNAMRRTVVGHGYLYTANISKSLLYDRNRLSIALTDPIRSVVCSFRPQP